MAFPDGWLHSIALTINHNDIDGDLTNWTLVFDQSFNAVLTQVNGPLDADGTRPSINGGGDIRFSSDAAGANRLAVDIRTWVTNNTPASATCEVAVKIPSVLSSVDTTIYMWWGKSGESQPGSATTYGQYNAYDSDYELVYPLCENTGSRFDRTSNQETLTPNSSPSAVSGVVCDANSFDGVDDYLYSGTSNAIEGGNTYSIECWSRAPYNQNAAGGGDAAVVTLAQVGVTSDALGFWCDEAEGSSSRTRVIAWLVAGERIVSDSNEWTDDDWQYLAGTSGSSQLKLLIDGVEVTDSPKNATISNTRANTRFVVGDWDFAADRYVRTGEIDELRISSAVRDDAWFAANYDNQRNKAGFLTLGSIVDLTTREGTIEQELKSLEQSASGTVTAPTFTGTIDQELKSLEQSMSSTYTLPTITGTIEQELTGFSQAAEGTYTLPVITGSIDQELKSLEQSASGTFAEAGVFTGTISQQSKTLDQSLSGTFTPYFMATVNQELKNIDQNLTGLNTPPAFTGSIDQTLNNYSQSATGNYLLPIITGTASQELKSFYQLIDVLFDPGLISGTITQEMKNHYQLAIADILGYLKNINTIKIKNIQNKIIVKLRGR